ncbi:MAG TPA: hypothetical protein VG501_00370 [Rhizomicrobium sp.]|nr:hypothetical protein [Rhizomicrobium sp.]
MTRKIIFALLLSATAARADFFASGYYTPSRGKVGQRLVSDAAFAVSDMPPACGSIEWKTITIEGALPPGLAPPGAYAGFVTPEKDANGIPINQAEVPDVAASAFFGTPSKPGEWPLTVVFHGLSCSSGQSYGDRAIKVNFHIEP